MKQTLRRTSSSGEQLSLPRTGGWGGKRPSAGRKRQLATRDGSSSHVSHAKRPVHKARHPVHVTLRARAGLPSFRQQRMHRLLAEVLRDPRRRNYGARFRVVHFSIQSSHLHLVVEADTDEAVSGQPLRAGLEP